MKRFTALTLVAAAAGLGACGTTSNVTKTPLGLVASVETNGPSGYHHTSCRVQAIRVGKRDGKPVFKYRIRQGREGPQCNFSAGDSVGSRVLTAAVPAAISGALGIVAAGKVDGGTTIVEGGTAFAGAFAEAGVSFRKGRKGRRRKR